MTLLEKRSEHLREMLSSALAHATEKVSRKQVHRLRTTIRRIDSLVEFAEPQLGKKQKKAIETLVALRKRAGRVRDRDVQLQLLSALGNNSAAADRKLLADQLKQKRAKHAERLQAALGRVTPEKFSSLFDSIEAQAASAPALVDESEEPLQRARRDLIELVAQFSSQAQLKPATMHEIRIRLKRARYLAEVAEKSPEQKEFLAAMKATQDTLGAWHDWEELAATAEKQFDNRMNCPVLVEIRALFAAKHSAALAAIAHLFAAWRPDSALKSSSALRTGSARKPSRSVEPARALAQRA